MSRRIKLGDTKVADVQHLLVEEPTTIGTGQGIDELLGKIIADPRTRHVYVVDEAGVLIGTVRMNRVVQYLFPFAAMVEQGSELSIGNMANFNVKLVEDIMDERPKFVKSSTTLVDMATILMREKINELPVVDEDMQVIGQINIYEVIMAYLKETREQ